MVVRRQNSLGNLFLLPSKQQIYRRSIFKTQPQNKFRIIQDCLLCKIKRNKTAITHCAFQEKSKYHSLKIHQAEQNVCVMFKWHATRLFESSVFWLCRGFERGLQKKKLHSEFGHNAYPDEIPATHIRHHLKMNLWHEIMKHHKRSK